LLYKILPPHIIKYLLWQFFFFAAEEKRCKGDGNQGAFPPNLEREKNLVYKVERGVLECSYTQGGGETWENSRPPFQFDEGFGEAQRGLG
jgi:hypothetical protein